MTQRACLRWIGIIQILAAGGSSLLPLRAAAQTAASAPPGTLTVMTYNLKFASPKPPNAWPQRRPLMGELIRQIAPDVFGTQEGLYRQLEDLAADLPAYQWIGLGRDGGSRGEFMAVFYRQARLEALAFDHFWLSDTPEVIGSMTWGPKLPRMVTWVKFRDRQTKQEFVFVNTHFDHQVQAAREKSAELVRQRVAGFEPGLPVLLVGDFNAAAGKNQAYARLTGDQFFADTWAAARERVNDGIGTFNGFKATQKDGPRIDWILSRGKVAVDRIEIVTFSRGGQFPSDHCPLVAKVRLGAAAPSAGEAK
jgi:endonuclease/exonuclease/phosphatase family metal-dependent hydrolase